jgi:hypothetical protein
MSLKNRMESRSMFEVVPLSVLRRCNDALL